MLNVYLTGTTNRQLEELLHSCGVRTTVCSADELTTAASQPSFRAQAVVFDLRDRPVMPSAVALLRREHPAVGIVIVAASLDPVLMLEAMRAGVTEFVTDPVTTIELKAAIDRVAAKRPKGSPGQVFAFVGGKGGVGTTTLAANVASALARIGTSGSSALLVDLHISYGDAALFVGAEPRFSIADALENVHRLDESFLHSLVGSTKFGLDVLASADRAMLGAVDARAIRGLIDCAARQYRYVVLDVPRSDTTILEALELTTTIVIVANQELSTIRSASRMAASLRQRYGKDRVTLVVSRYDHHAEIGRKEIERVLGGEIAHVFPSNYRLALGAMNTGRPLVLDNHNKLAAAFEGFAHGLAKAPQAAAKPQVPDASPERANGLLGRFRLRTS
jgi:pilus assembly protein CpaE